jgi:hypothetical protein
MIIIKNNKNTYLTFELEKISLQVQREQSFLIDIIILVKEVL